MSQLITFIQQQTGARLNAVPANSWMQRTWARSLFLFLLLLNVFQVSGIVSFLLLCALR